MRVPLKWLRDYVPVRAEVRDVAHKLTMAGLEVTSIETTGNDWDGVVVGYVEEVNPHPNADRLRLVTVDAGGKRHEVVCGAPNVAAGQKIAYANLGAKLIDGRSGEPTTLKKAKIRGVVSKGMVCSERELGLSDEHEGILVLSESAPVGRPLVEVLGDTVLVIDMKPNRADGLSVVGVARDVAALTGQRLGEPSLEFAAKGAPIEGRASVVIEDDDLCARFTLALIEGITIGPSPAWMQERLLGAGMRPINNVVDITNYVMLELGQPIHAFDYDTVADHKIIVRRARDGETLTTLDDKERTFTRDQLLITDPSGPIAVAGVMGGLATEVTEKTKNILLEVANFDPVSIRRTAMALKLPSEASRRFAWGIAPELAPMASRRVTKFLVELAGGTAAEGLIDAYPRPSEPVSISLPAKRIPQVLGVDPERATVVSSLTALGFGVRESQDSLAVDVPYWRRDVQGADDVVEEIARIVGYETIPAEPLAGRVPPRVPQPVLELKERSRDILVRAGMQEAITYPLTSVSTLALVVPEEELARDEPLSIVNPLIVGQDRMRTSLRASMLECVARNQRNGRERVAMFEVARIYLPTSGSLPTEREHVVGAVTGPRLDRWGAPVEESVDFFDAKAFVARLFESLAVPVQYSDAECFGFLSGRTAELRVGEATAGGVSVGVLGQVHPETADKFGIGQDLYLFDIDLETLLPHVPDVVRFESVSKFPAVVEDLALIVGVEQTAASVIDEVLSHSLVTEAHVFDEYHGAPVPERKKSLAVAVSYQVPDRTLTDKEVAKARDKILARLRGKLGAELRR